MKKLKNRKIGMVGLGYWGKNILRNLNDLGVLHAACDPSPKTMNTLKENTLIRLKDQILIL